MTYIRRLLRSAASRDFFFFFFKWRKKIVSFLNLADHFPVADFPLFLFILVDYFFFLWKHFFFTKIWRVLNWIFPLNWTDFLLRSVANFGIKIRFCSFDFFLIRKNLFKLFWIISVIWRFLEVNWMFARLSNCQIKSQKFAFHKFQ